MKKAIKSNGAINYCLTTLDTSGRTLEKERGRERQKIWPKTFEVC